MESKNPVTKRPGRGLAALAAMASLLGTTDHGPEKKSEPSSRRYRHGKHNGQHAGAFGGSKARKKHRQ